MTKQPHTPTPYSRTSLTIDKKEWAKYLANDPAQALMINWDGMTGGMVAIVFGDTDEEAEATAKFMQSACNAHDELVAALEEIAKGKGRFSVDKLTHAKNTIEDMKAVAIAALAKARGEA